MQTGYFMTLVWLQWTTNIPSKLKHCLLTTSEASASRTTAKSTTTHTSKVATAQTTTSSSVARCGIQEQLNVTMLHVFLILKQMANFYFEFKFQLKLLTRTKWGSKNGNIPLCSSPKCSTFCHHKTSSSKLQSITKWDTALLASHVLRCQTEKTDCRCGKQLLRESINNCRQLTWCWHKLGDGQGANNSLW